MDRFIGRLLDNRYEILEVLGTGGMAIVYKARCHRLNRMVAIKVLKDENLQDEDFCRRFHAEGQAVAMLSHPNIVSVYDVSTTGDADYIVMELVDGITLKQYMERKGMLNWKETIHFATQIAKALEHAHSRGIVHRDIKPHNVMVLKNGSVRVTDFGIARDMSKSATLTKEALGSVHYISPEQARGDLVDTRSDLYSLGVVMYEMITGRPPFDGESPVSVAIQHIAGGAIRPSSINPNMPAGLEQIILKAMSPDLKNRYATAADMLADLDLLRKDPTAVLAAREKQPKIELVETPKEEQPVKKMETKKPAPEKKPKVKRKKTYEEAALTRGRVTTISIVLCSVVAMVAIVLFLFLMASGNLLNQETQLVRVPDLVGKHFDALPKYETIQVVKQSEVYSDEFEAGKIIQQLPLANTEVEPGRTVFVTVSAGPRPDAVKIKELTGLYRSEAQSYLLNLKLDLQVEIREAYHDTVEEGYVIECNLTEGTVLHKGQKVILTVSLGREVIYAEMPDLLRGNGKDKTEAESILSMRGLNNILWVPVDSLLPEGTVMSQSVPAGERIDVTTLIVIEYSTGIPPVIPPVVLTHTFTDLPLREEAYRISILCGGEFIVVDRWIQPGETEFTLELSGNGSVQYDIYINDAFYKTVTVVFEADE